VKKKDIYVVSRMYKPLEVIYNKKKLVHKGSPAYFELIKFYENDPSFNLYLIFILDIKSDKKIKSFFLDEIKNKIQVVKYFNLFLLKNSKLEYLINKFYAYIKIFFLVKKKSIYYLDRDNLLLLYVLKFKKGLIVFRLLGLTKKIHDILINKRSFIGSLYRKIFKSSSVLFFCTRDGSWHDSLKKNLRNENLHILFNGYNLQTHQKKSNRSIFKLLYVSRLENGKGLTDFIQIIENYLNKYGKKDFDVTIVGDGSLKKKLIQICNEKNIHSNVSFIGDINHKQLDKIYSQSSLFVSLNSFGIYSNTVIEASANNLPIIALDNKNIVDSIKDSFYLVDKNDYDSLHDVIFKFKIDNLFYKKYQLKSNSFFNINISSWDKRLQKEKEIINNFLIKK